jgi:acyl-CoA-binding protein
MSLDDNLRQKLEDAATRAKSLPKQDNEVLLELYGLYKQANLGDVTGEAPGMFDFVANAKYQAWSSRQGMSQAAAVDAYIELVDRLSGASGS